VVKWATRAVAGVGVFFLGASARASGNLSDDSSISGSAADTGTAEVKPLMLGPQIVNPAEEFRPPQTQPQSQPYGSGSVDIVHPWELPPVEIVGQRTPELREEQRVGSYAQPLWTADRRFAETRVYVRPEGSLEFESWFIPTVNRNGPTVFQTQYELEFGLPHRFQLDLYFNPTYVGSGPGSRTFTNQAVELRYALADWGVIWGNPTLYAEYTRQDQGPDELETKILFGGELAPRFHWGFDLTYQRDFGGLFTNTYETTGGLSYTLIDSRIDLGAEAKVQLFDVHDHRGRFTDNVFLGPSVQFRPLARAHVDVVPLIGLTHESPALELYIVFGWEF
jgi:hypothetical protein